MARENILQSVKEEIKMNQDSNLMISKSSLNNDQTRYVS